MSTDQLSETALASIDSNFSTIGQIEALKVTIELLITTLALDADLPPFLNELSSGIEIKEKNYSKVLFDQDERIAKSFTQTINQIQEYIKNLNSYISTGEIN